MKLLRILADISFLFNLEGVLCVQKSTEISLLKEVKSVGSKKSNFFYRRDFYYHVLDNYVSLYDKNLILVNSYSLRGVYGVLDIFSKGEFILRVENGDIDFDHFILDGEVIKQPRVYGVFLSLDYRLNFSDNVLTNPTTLRCTDLLAKQTYWEYQCKDGEQAISRWYVWEGYLLFCTHKSGYMNGNLVMIRLDSGEIVWQIPISYTDLNFDENQGVFVSLWASHGNGKNFQIIDLNKREIESGEVVTDYSLENVNVHWQLQSFADRKLYFVDNLAYFNIPAEKNPKFGRFDLDTKQIDFLQELPEAAGSQISQTIYCDGNLYLRTTKNELFIFE